MIIKKSNPNYGAITRRTPNYGALVPATMLPKGVPEGLVEIGLGALLGYLIGNTKQQPAIGALIGGIVGGIAGQLKLPGQVPLQNTYVASATPGITQPGTKPGQAGFDVGAAGTIIEKVLGKEGLTGTVQSLANIIKKAWGTDTAQPVTNLEAEKAAQYVPWTGEPFYSDPCANGGCVKIDSSTVSGSGVSTQPENYVEVAPPTETDWSSTDWS